MATGLPKKCSRLSARGTIRMVGAGLVGGASPDMVAGLGPWTCKVRWSLQWSSSSLPLFRSRAHEYSYPTAALHAGFVAYFYDKIRPGTAVELNQCRYNHMGMDVLYRHQPNFRSGLPGVGGCRNGAKECEDCMVTDPKVCIPC